MVEVKQYLVVQIGIQCNFNFIIGVKQVKGYQEGNKEWENLRIIL